MASQATADGGPPQPDRTMEFVALLRKHDRQLSTFVHAALPSWQDAEDVVQETLVRLWEQFDRYEPGTNFGAWACTVARYLVLAQRERAGRERLQFSPELIERIALQVEHTSCLQDERRRHLAACVQEVSAANRELLRMFYARGMPVKEIADLLGRSANATYLAISRLRRGLHDCVARRLASSDAGLEA